VLGSHGGVRVVVEDHGPGIADENKRAVFEPFRGGPMRSAHAPGTGIGLALVHRLVQLHGGQVWVEDRIGGGACFVVDLPAEQPAAAELVGHALAR